jgi:hypothetical protein
VLRGAVSQAGVLDPAADAWRVCTEALARLL